MAVYQKIKRFDHRASRSCDFGVCFMFLMHVKEVGVPVFVQQEMIPGGEPFSHRSQSSVLFIYLETVYSKH